MPVEPETVFQEDTEDVFEYETELVPGTYTAGAPEVIGDVQPGGGSAHAKDKQESTRVFIIPANQKRSFRRYMLGLSYTGVGSDGDEYLLRREPPARDPEFPELRAYAVAFSDTAPKADEAHPFAADETGHPEATGWKCNRYTSPFVGANDETMYYAGYQKCFATVNYRSFARTRFSPDVGFTYLTEWRRYTDWRTVPSLETLSVQGMGSGVAYAETPDGLVGEDPNGKPFPADTFEYMHFKVITCTWYGVPHEYISDDDYGLNTTNIDACVGRVNDREMFGVYPKGTLLMLAPEFTPTLFPVTPAACATTSDDTEIIGGWDVTLTFKHFDPPKGRADSEYRGHNLFPWRGKGPSGGVELGKWLYCTRNGEADGPLFIPEADFRNIFRHVSDPGV